MKMTKRLRQCLLRNTDSTDLTKTSPHQHPRRQSLADPGISSKSRASSMMVWWREFWTKGNHPVPSQSQTASSKAHPHSSGWCLLPCWHRHFRTVLTAYTSDTGLTKSCSTPDTCRLSQRWKKLSLETFSLLTTVPSMPAHSKWCSPAGIDSPRHVTTSGSPSVQRRPKWCISLLPERRTRSHQSQWKGRHLRQLTTLPNWDVPCLELSTLMLRSTAGSWKQVQPSRDITKMSGCAAESAFPPSWTFTIHIAHHAPVSP